MKTILVPVDLSAATPRVCAAACELAQSTGGSVVLLHVVPSPPAMMNDYYAFDTGHMAQAMIAVEKDGLRRLNRVARRYEKTGVPLQALQCTGEPVPTILAQAKKLKADCVVLGSHGHGAVFDLIVGSTTHGVLRKAKCPVFVVPVAKR